MGRALTIEKSTGKLRLLEADVAQHVTGFLQWNKWECTRTHVIRAQSTIGYINTGELGQADYICTRPMADSIGQLFWLETKRYLGKHTKQHLATQAEWQQYMRSRGYLVCVLPMDVPDLGVWFEEWYRKHFGDNLLS